MTRDLSARSVADLLTQASDQTATLVRQELELAKAELTIKGKQVGLGAGMFGGAGVFGVYAFGALTAAIILALSLAVTGWLAALIVAVAYGAVAGVTGAAGQEQGQGRHAADARADGAEREGRCAINQGTPQGGPAMTDDQTGNGADATRETKSPEQIRAEIEQTREELGDTVEALAEKTDVKAQAKSRISAAKDTAQTKRDEYAGKAKRAAPESASAGADQLASTVQDKPLPFAVGAAFAIGRATAGCSDGADEQRKALIMGKLVFLPVSIGGETGRRPDRQEALRRDLGS